MITSVIVILAGNAVLLSTLAVVGWRNRTTPSARWFTALQVTSMLWVLVTIAQLLRPLGPLHVRLWGIANGLSLVVSALWFGFILHYTGRERWMTVDRFGVVVAPLVSGGVLFAVAPSWKPLVADIVEATVPAGNVVQATIGPLGGLIGLYLYSMFVAGLVLVLKTVLESESLFLGPAIALLLGTLVTVVASAARIFGYLPVRGYPMTQVALGGQSLFWGYAVFRQQFLDIVPAVARIGERAVFEDLDDGLLVADEDGMILRANTQARTYLDSDELVGQSLDSLLDRIGASSFEDLPCSFQHQGRACRVTGSTVTGWRDEPIGRTLVIRDVTGLVQRQQRLQVLNRILRHNVRNDVLVIRGTANEIRRRLDGELADLGTKVVEKADDLATVSEKARDIEQLLKSSNETECVDVAAVVADVVSPLTDQYPGADVDVTVTVDELRTNRKLLAIVLTEVVENALTHTDDHPWVSIEVTRSDGHVEFVVEDDGPGIPDEEIEPIRAGEESDLNHASSLGLWLVYWGTQSLGGDLEIDSTETGSLVVLSLPGRLASDSDATTRTTAPTK